MAGRATVKPGESTTISATLKTAGHTGIQSKTISVETSDPENPILALVFSLDIFAATPVPGAERTPQPSALFKAECAQCHVPKQDRTKPSELYEDTCFMCHGTIPGISPPAGVAVSDDIGPIGMRDARVLANIIRDGLPQTEMPPFSMKWQGPLSEEQIKALADFISKAGAVPPRPVRIDQLKPKTPRKGLPAKHPKVQGHDHGKSAADLQSPVHGPDDGHNHPH